MLYTAIFRGAPTGGTDNSEGVRLIDKEAPLITHELNSVFSQRCDGPGRRKNAVSDQQRPLPCAPVPLQRRSQRVDVAVSERDTRDLQQPHGILEIVVRVFIEKQDVIRILDTSQPHATQQITRSKVDARPCRTGVRYLPSSAAKISSVAPFAAGSCSANGTPRSSAPTPPLLLPAPRTTPDIHTR